MHNLLIRILGVGAFLFLVVGLGGCDSEKEYSARDLRDLRVIGLIADQPEVSIGQLIPAFTAIYEPDGDFTPTVVSRIRVVDHHPMDLEATPVARSYSWLMCFSLGGFTRFECLGDSQIFPEQGPIMAVTDTMVAEAVLSLFKGTAAEGDDSGGGIPLPSPEMLTGSTECVPVPADSCTADSDCVSGGLCQFGTCAPVPDILSIPLVMRVRIEAEDGQVREAVRSLPIRLRGELNHNPTLQSLKVDGRVLNFEGVDGCLSVDNVDFSKSVELEAVPDASAIEAYESFEDGECTTTDEEDSMFLSWYSTAGELRQGLGRSESLENEFSGYETDVYGKKIVQDLQRARIYVSIRDGRDGLSVSCLDLHAAEP